MNGFVVMESCEDYEQALVLRTGKGMPPGGILDWSERRGCEARAVFATRRQARDAINRTEHYRLAYARTDLPERKLCNVVPVRLVPSNTGS